MSSIWTARTYGPTEIGISLWVSGDTAQRHCSTRHTTYNTLSLSLCALPLSPYLHPYSRTPHITLSLFPSLSLSLKDGVHKVDDTSGETDGDTQKLLRTQDASYLHLKRGTERKQVEKLQSELHFLQSGPVAGRKHTIFVDDNEGAAAFDPAEHFDTDKSLVSRAYVATCSSVFG